MSLSEASADIAVLAVVTRSEIIFCGDLIDNFQDTAAILKSIDIVISVDTSLAHLSGALSIKTLVQLPLVAEWRWQEKREGSVVKKAELSISKVALRN